MKTYFIRLSLIATLALVLLPKSVQAGPADRLAQGLTHATFEARALAQDTKLYQASRELFFGSFEMSTVGDRAVIYSLDPASFLQRSGIETRMIEADVAKDLPRFQNAQVKSQAPGLVAEILKNMGIQKTDAVGKRLTQAPLISTEGNPSRIGIYRELFIELEVQPKNYREFAEKIDEIENLIQGRSARMNREAVAAKQALRAKIDQKKFEVISSVITDMNARLGNALNRGGSEVSTTLAAKPVEAARGPAITAGAGSAGVHSASQ